MTNYYYNRPRTLEDSCCEAINQKYVLLRVYDEELNELIEFEPWVYQKVFAYSFLQYEVESEEIYANVMTVVLRGI